jgi:deoxyribodipyrimidine photo-lyase
MSTVVMLFTRDLRVRDQPALAAAARGENRVLPLFVLDDSLLRGPCGAANRLAFLLDALRDLDGSLRERGGGLVLRRGDPVAEAMRAAAEIGAEAIHLSDDWSPHARHRLKRLEAESARQRISLRTFPGVTIVSPGDVVPQGGDHYRVFSPYLRAWSERPRRGALAAPRRLRQPRGIKGERMPTLSQLARGTRSPRIPRGGETAARRRLEHWLRSGLAGYEQGQDQLAADATSRLSADLHFGCLSPLAVLARVEGRPGGAAFARQLCWRDFLHQVLAARPDLTRVDYRSRGDRWRREERPADAWRAGHTGFPIIDAAMRQLLAEGFIPNRARMIAGSFLAKSLYVDWRIGAAHFAQLLVDADVACNYGNWQWVAGTGNDTRPNRVLNPVRQAHRFDPDGDYVRRHVPELAGIHGPAVHEPWLLEPSERRALDYPGPIIDPGEAGTRFRSFHRAKRGVGKPT